MYPYPQYFERTYVNPSGNIIASGYYVSHITQEIANKYPTWHAIRDNNESVGQEFISPFARILHGLERNMAEDLNNNFISLAPVDEIDVIYRMKVPSTISFLTNPNIECWTAPSGATPSGYPFPEPSGANPDTFNQIQATPITDLEEFYYHLIPTRIKVFNEEAYTDARADGIGITFPVRPSGIDDTIQKYIDRAKKEHDIVWAHQEFTPNAEYPNGSLTPILKYSMNDNAPSTFVTDSMLNYNGTLSGGKNTDNVSTVNMAGWGAKIGSAFVFDGAADYIDCGNDLQTTFRSSFSVSVWINASEGQTPPITGRVGSIFGTFVVVSHSPRNGVELRINQEGKIYVYYNSTIGIGAGAQGLTANAVLPSGRTGWTHIVWVVDDNTNMMYLYVNGDLKPWGTSFDGTMTQTMANYTNSFNAFVGARNWGGTANTFYDGALDSLMVYPFALSQSQVSEIYQNSNNVNDMSYIFYKNDKESLGNYEQYLAGASGYPAGFTLYNDYMWWMGYVPPSGYFLNLSNTHPAPGSEYLDHIASYDMTDLILGGDSPPSGVAVDEEGMLWILNEDRQILYAVAPMYDYFLVDKDNRYLYFREDYSNPGVFVKPA